MDKCVELLKQWSELGYEIIKDGRLTCDLPDCSICPERRKLVNDTDEYLKEVIKDAE